MAIGCCINIASPSSTPLAAPSSSKASYGKVGSWRKKCVVGMTCMIIGTETMMPLFGNELVAQSMQQVQVEESKARVSRWGDKRGCPPWTINSYEIIVPENLPRPSSHRKSEFVALPKGTTTSSNPPAVRLVKRINGSACFSM